MNSPENGIYEVLTEQEHDLFGSLLDLKAEKVSETCWSWRLTIFELRPWIRLFDCVNVTILDFDKAWRSHWINVTSVLHLVLQHLIFTTTLRKVLFLSFYISESRLTTVKRVTQITSQPRWTSLLVWLAQGPCSVHRPHEQAERRTGVSTHEQQQEEDCDEAASAPN